jgi:hypothetical protein
MLTLKVNVYCADLQLFFHKFSKSNSRKDLLNHIKASHEKKSMYRTVFFISL